MPRYLLWKLFFCIASKSISIPHVPCCFLKSYSPEDNRFDLRQFLYNSRWPFQFRKIDELVKEMNGDKVHLAGSDDNDKPGLVSDHVGGMGVAAAGSGNPNVGF